MAFISVTRLRLRSVRFLPAFLFYAVRSGTEARQTPGNLAFQTRQTRPLTFWTLTSWEDEEAMKRFRGAGSHRIAMTKLAHWCDEAVYGHWHQDIPDLPSWEIAARHLRDHGLLSKVRHPSPKQRDGIIAID